VTLVPRRRMDPGSDARGDTFFWFLVSGFCSVNPHPRIRSGAGSEVAHSALEGWSLARHESQPPCFVRLFDEVSTGAEPAPAQASRVKPPASGHPWKPKMVSGADGETLKKFRFRFLLP